MKPYVPCLLLTVAGALSLAPSPAKAAADPTTQLSAIYQKTDAAADRKDIDGCLAFHTPDFMALDETGKVETNDQERSRLQHLFDSVGPLDITTRIEKCDYADKTATVIIAQHIKTTVASPDTGKDMPVSGDVVARELWTRDSSGWKMDVAQTLSAGSLTPDQQ